jgi:hypothetical protein
MIQITRFIPAMTEVEMTFNCETIEQARELFNEGDFEMKIKDTYDLDFDDVDPEMFK